MGIVSSGFLTFAPKTWRDAFEKAATLPVAGRIIGPDGLIHDVVGNFTMCDLCWCPSSKTVAPGWHIVTGPAAATCLACTAGAF